MVDGPGMHESMMTIHFCERRNHVYIWIDSHLEVGTKDLEWHRRYWRGKWIVLQIPTCTAVFVLCSTITHQLYFQDQPRTKAN